MTDLDTQLTSWVEAYGDLIVRTCCLYLGDRTLAEDAAQETFIKAWKSASRFEGRNGASAKTWLIAIAINTCKNMQRKPWFSREDRSITPEEIPMPVRDEDRTLMMDVLRLPNKQKQAVLLHYYHHMTLQEMAQAMGVGTTTAHHHLKRALRALRVDMEGGKADD